MNNTPERSAIEPKSSPVDSAESLFLEAKKANGKTLESAQNQFSKNELQEACMAVYTKSTSPEDQQACLYLGKSLGLPVDEKLLDPKYKEYEIADRGMMVLTNNNSLKS